MRETQPAPIASIAEAVGVDAADLVAPVDPAPPPGDLAAEIARFTTLDACVKERAKLDPLVGDALRSIGYETFVRDACRLLEAAKAKNAAKCAPIDASALRERCEAYVAMVTSNADACPWAVPSEPTLGREPSCVAVAARDPRLCAGEERGRRAMCEAVATRDGARCDAAPAAAQDECRREAARWQGVLPAPSGTGDLPTAKGRIQIQPAPGSGGATPPDQDWTPVLASGVVLALAGDGDHVTLGASRDLGASAVAASPEAPVRLSIALIVTKEAPADARVDHLELDLPGEAPIVCPGTSCAVTARVQKLARSRGGEVAVAVDGTAGTSSRAVKLHVEASTFVRDVVKQGIRALDAGPLPLP